MEKNIKIKITSEEILIGKFGTTITHMLALCLEFQEPDKECLSQAVYQRVSAIKDMFEKDLKNLANDITIE